eukprot:TRINITY_DN17010_c0_g1_i4.p1 TRINITY_DN17010_c0_g1~~TRINITY_DN17010_c0_g1_i4.p1  ORF type:complete len:160 (+),score=23.86 TRINITY_DN17010_c0_g1_i4:221-700(+)
MKTEAIATADPSAGDQTACRTIPGGSPRGARWSAELQDFYIGDLPELSLAEDSDLDRNRSDVASSRQAWKRRLRISFGVACAAPLLVVAAFAVCCFWSILDGAPVWRIFTSYWNFAFAARTPAGAAVASKGTRPDAAGLDEGLHAALERVARPPTRRHS